MTGKPLYLSALVDDKTAPGKTPTTDAKKAAPAEHPSRNRREHAGGFRQGKGRGGRSGDHRRRMMPSQPHMKKEADDKIPPIGDAIRIIPLGGVEEIGKNMIAIEYGDDIVVIDMGFQFKDENTPGIDYILPNTKYLEERKNKVRAVIITHGHLDHTGGIPYLMERIGNPPLYSRSLTTIMIRKRLEEFPHIPKVDIRIVEKEESIMAGKLKVRFFSVSHTIPDSMGIIVETPYGVIVDPGDPKLDHVDGVPTEAEQKEYAKFEKENVLMLLNDSTNIENPGFSTPERLVHKNLEEIIRSIKGRLIIGTFASQLERIMNIILCAEKFGKKVVIEGRSMKSNVEVAKLSGMFKVKPETIIPVEEIENYPADRIVVLSTGAQGEEFAALMRISTKMHRHLKLRKGDTVLLSSSIIPGNEKTVQKLKDNLTRQGAKIIHYRTSDVYIHSTGHGNKGELEWMFKHIHPKFFMPVHGHHYMLHLHAEMIENLGMPKENIIVPDNGTIAEIRDKGTKLVRLKEKAPSGLILVDGFAIGDVQEVVLRDRQMLAEDGMFVIIATVDSRTGKLKKSPDIISRGFVYLRESQELLRLARIIIKKTVEDSSKGMNPINFDFVKQNVADELGKFLFQKTAKRPIVIPVLLGV
ncbi:MAG: ribonuclease J [Candidatus Pacebacteria bacterium]|nr:ribonuclease J [Candidatus Paceibacterota bacterium]